MSTKLCARFCLLGALLAVSTLACRQSAIEKLGGAELIRQAFIDLHRQVYDLYSLEDTREGVWDLLARVFAGEALTHEYVEHFTTLAHMQREGIAIDVLTVDYESVSLVDKEREVLVEADWSVGGIVHHQSHKHLRINRYRALYTLAAPNPKRGLRIVATRLLSAERVTASPRAVTGFPLDDLPTSERGLVGPAELLRGGLLDQATPKAPEPQ